MDLTATTPTRLLLIAPPSPHREELAATLQLQGHELDLAADIAAAEPLLGRKPSLALISLCDDRLDGLAAARGLRKLASEVPLLALVPVADRQARVRCLNAGFDDLLAQPVDALELRVRVRALLQSSQAASRERDLAIAHDRQIALGTLTASVAHDLCNRAVRMQHQLDELCDALPVPLEDQAALRRALGEVVGASKQLSQLARLSRPEPAEMLHLGDELRRVLKQLVDMGPLRHVELVLRAPDDAWIFAERAHLEQLTCNLVTAALESVSDLPASERAVSLQVELRGATIALRVEGLRPAGRGFNSARPRSAPRPLGLGPKAVQALAAACGGRTALEPSYSGRHALVVILPGGAAPEEERSTALASSAA